ncbi:MAG: tryptophan synthase subunit alpha [Acetobacteraceae bacterium]
MSRIAARFSALRKAGRGALIPFLEAFDPDRGTSSALLAGMPAAGADLIEIGVPFTDPMADGPIIQAAGKRALRAGASLRGVLAMVDEFRAREAEIPIILMGYLNPILAYGVAPFARDAARSGVDGLIIVDLPAEESDLLVPDANRNGLDIIRLVAPTTDDQRLPKVLEGSSGFVYYVSITGITGTKSATTAELADNIPRIRKLTRLPIAVGFGVKTPEQAAEVVSIADAAVVASALIARLAAALDHQGRPLQGAVEQVLGDVRALAGSVRTARAAA